MTCFCRRAMATLRRHRYAGYEKEEKPVVAGSQIKIKPSLYGSTRSLMLCKKDRTQAGTSVLPVDWCMQLDALRANRVALNISFSGRWATACHWLTSAFANTLVAVIWNGDTRKPLFSNYWSGANGWFRVAYDNGTGQCREGYPPYGLTDSFPTGGYSTWAQHRPVIGLLGQRLYDLINAPNDTNSPFIMKYYPAFSKLASAQNRALAKIMFFPSLVGVPYKQ